MATTEDTAKLRTLLYVHRLALANPTGIARYIVELAEALVRLDTEFAIELCSGRTKEQPDPIDVPVSQLHWPRRPTHILWALVQRPVLERAAGSTALVHLTSPYFPVPSKAPLVLTIHDMLPITHPEWYPPQHRWSFGRSVRYHARKGAHIITPSESVADDVESILGVPRDRITATSEGVNARFQGAVDDEVADGVCTRYGLHDTPFFVALGGLTPRKNLGVVFDAIAELASREPTPRLVVVGGDAAYAEQTYETARRSGTPDLITFTGRLPDADVHALLSRAAAHVHPSMSEGFGLTTLEAMAAGTPCIASRAGALPEVVGDAGLLVDPRDATAWAEAMARVIDDRELRGRLQADGRRHAAGFTWQAAAERTVEVYRTAVAQAR